MNASEALELTRQNGSLKPIFNSIKVSAKNGCYTLVTQGITNGQKMEFERLGYTVELSTTGYADKIRWG